MATMPTDENGFYSVKVKPGTYDVEASGGSPLPSCAKQVVTVVAKTGQTTTANISCDTGIR